MRNRALPFLGECYSDEARPFSSQDVCNWLPAPAEKPGTLSPEMAQTPPGLAPFVQIAGINGTKPVRGTHNCEGKLFSVIGSQLYQISNKGVAIPLGTIPGITRTRFAHNQITNGNQLVVVNGSAGYTYDTPTQVFERITDPGYPGGITADFVDGYIIGIEPGRRFAYNSDLANAREYNTLDRFTSEYKPDLLVTQVVSNNELILLSETSGEVFYNSGASQQPFRTKRVFFDKGCSGRCNAAVVDNSFVFHSSDGMFYLYEGGVPRRISTRPIEQAVAGLNWSQAFAEVWVDGGHSVVYWTFPGGHTWGWDASSGKWHRRASYGMDRWRVNTLTKWTRSGPGARDEWIAGDFQSGRLWRLDWDYFLEGDDEFVSEIVGVVMSDNQNPVTMPRLEPMLDTGQELTVPREFPAQPEPPTITGAAPDGTVGVPYSAFPYVLANGTPPYTVTKRTGTFPANLGPISVAGVIPAVTPNAVGEGTIVLRNTDANGLFAEHTDTIKINEEVFASYQIANPLISSILRGGDGSAWSAATYANAGGTGDADFVDSYWGKLFSVRNTGTGRVSSDRGATFTDITGLPALAPCLTMTATPDEFLLFAYGNPVAGLYVSPKSDGATFTTRSMGLPDSYVFGSVSRGNAVVITCGVVSHAIRRSLDKGFTWAQVVLAGVTTPQSITDSGTTLVVFDYSPNGGASISRDLGGTWSLKTLPANAGISASAYDTEHERLVCIDKDGQSFYSDDDGTTWLAGGATSHAITTDAVFYDNQMIYANGLLVVGGTAGQISTSDDGGATWTRVFNGGSDPVVSITALRSGQ